MRNEAKKREIKKEYENEVLDISRVERMTAGGRRLRFRTLVIVGNKKGKVGAGTAKGHDVQQSIEKSTKKAEKSAVKVPIAKGGTIPHEVKAKYGAAVVLLKPQSEGRGLVAGGTVRSICSMAGIENISGKLLGNTRNKLNNAKATIKALQMLKGFSTGEESKEKEEESKKTEEKEEESKKTEEKEKEEKKTNNKENKEKKESSKEKNSLKEEKNKPAEKKKKPETKNANSRTKAKK